MFSHKLLVEYELLWTFLESNLTDCPEIKAAALPSAAAHISGNFCQSMGAPEEAKPSGYKS